MKPKLVLISGLTAVGKTLIASQLAKKLNTEIIVGDSLQIYKNYVISSNYPSPLELKFTKYNLLGQIDVFQKRIISSEYKQMVLNEISRIHKNGCTPIIEGGSGFYLNYLLTSSDHMYDEAKWDGATEEARKIREDLNDGNKMIEKLQEICPHYDNSIPPSDLYRLEKALKYAIASDGKTFLWTDQTEEKLKEIFDVRGFFLTTAQEKLKPIIDERCYQMVLNGMIHEFLDFIEKGQKSFYNYSEGPVPIGYQESAELLNGLIQLRDNIYVNNAQNLKRMSQLEKDFIDKFQIKSRQYAAIQRKYFRSKFKYFSWKEVDPATKHNPAKLLDEIYEEIMLPQESFQEKTNSLKNIAVINKISDKSNSKTFSATHNLKYDNLILQKITGEIMPRISSLNKIDIFQYPNT